MVPLDGPPPNDDEESRKLARRAAEVDIRRYLATRRPDPEDSVSSPSLGDITPPSLEHSGASDASLAKVQDTKTPLTVSAEREPITDSGSLLQSSLAPVNKEPSVLTAETAETTVEETDKPKIGFEAIHSASGAPEPLHQAPPVSPYCDEKLDAPFEESPPTSQLAEFDESVPDAPPPSSGPAAPSVTGFRLGHYTCQVLEALPRNWYRVTIVGETIPGLARVPLDAAETDAWKRLPAHRVVPRLLHVGSDGLLIHADDAPPMALPLEPSEALGVLASLAQLVFFLHKQGVAMFDLEPSAVRLGPDGPKLSLPPRIVGIGQPVPRIYRDGFTPEELCNEDHLASGSEGIYLLGALLHHMLTGRGVPADGLTRSDLARFETPGVPQILACTLASIEERETPEGLLELIRATRAPEPAVFNVGMSTSVGRNPERPVNEDACGFSLGHAVPRGPLGPVFRAAVADGMGGMAAGELASAAAVAAFLDAPMPADLPQPDAALALLWRANERVQDALNGRDGGCTFSGVIGTGNRLALAHVGDSRAYLVQVGGNLRRLTRDHSLVAMLVASGEMSEAEAEKSPERNKVLRSLGSLRQAQADYFDDFTPMLGSRTLDLGLGELVLLLSDGIWGELHDQGIAQVIRETERDAQTIAEALVAAAVQAGGPDNATALVIQRLR